jgi:hypothetical protein
MVAKVFTSSYQIHFNIAMNTNGKDRLQNFLAIHSTNFFEDVSLVIK